MNEKMARRRKNIAEYSRKKNTREGERVREEWDREGKKEKKGVERKDVRFKTENNTEFYVKGKF